jgi:predicted nucleic acid-binding Zn ribbon protein
MSRQTDRQTERQRDRKTRMLFTIISFLSISKVWLEKI